MPYIKTERRNKIAPVVHGSHARVESQYIENAGDLNYAFTVLAIDYIKRLGLNYQNINDIVGALDGAKAEFQRRLVSNYEDQKIEESGDIYPSLKTPKYPSVGEFNGS